MGRHSDPAKRREWANAETDVGFQKSDRELVSDVYDASSSSPSSHPDEFMALTTAKFASLLASVSRQQSEFAMSGSPLVVFCHFKSAALDRAPVRTVVMHSTCAA